MAVSTILILALGSNHDQQRHIEEAITNLSRQFKNIRFTSRVWTEPIGIESDKFLNCLAYVNTSHTINQIRRTLRQVEIKCKDTKTLRKKNTVNLDIDILLHGKTVFHEEDWHRDYIIKLLKDIEQ